MNIRSLLGIAVLGILLAPASFAQTTESVDATVTDPVPALYEEEVAPTEETAATPTLAETLYQKELARCKALQNPAERRRCIFDLERERRARAPRSYLDLENKTPEEARAAMQEAKKTFKEKTETLREERKQNMEEARALIRERLQNRAFPELAGMSGQAPSYGQTLLRRRTINSAIRGEGASNTQQADVEGRVETRTLSVPGATRTAPETPLYWNRLRESE